MAHPAHSAVPSQPPMVQPIQPIQPIQNMNMNGSPWITTNHSAINHSVSPKVNPYLNMNNGYTPRNVANPYLNNFNGIQSVHHHNSHLNARSDGIRRPIDW